ncbi:unnamed protein product [Symbiodinium natans]|uniref:Uncharacterized protein n=1 Tax=Symbiodinium natans TaxID=878477 RepID=A0A812I6L0_9DINO|nr:unnamed protein product [Symbiodinium natans]
MDLLDDEVATRCLAEVRSNQWDVILVTPPCSTFSRVRFVQPGPKPLRSRLYPLGFPWLSNKLQMQADQGNQFVHFSFRICEAALEVRADFLLEHPEDLGRTKGGHVPASIWQLPEAQRLMSHERVFTFAIYQCRFHATSPKPTRFLTSITACQQMPFVGPPRFNSEERYLGPLPRFCGHKDHDSLLGKLSAGGWKATPAAAYPAALCAQISEWAFSVFDGGRPAAIPQVDTSGAGIIFRFDPVLLSSQQLGGEGAEGLAANMLSAGQAYESQLLRLSELLPDEDRVRESSVVIKGQRSFTTGAYCHHGKAGLRRNMASFPLSSELLAKLITTNFTGRPFTSMAFFRDIGQPLHKDTTNGSYDNLLLACSSFMDGGLWVQTEGGQIVRNAGGKPVGGEILLWGQGKICFNPHNWHSTESWTGTRLVLAAYSISQDGLLADGDRKKLVDMGFEVPGLRKRGPECLTEDAVVETLGKGGALSKTTGEETLGKGGALSKTTVEDIPYSELQSGCEGPPMVGEFAGLKDEFVDGFGRFVVDSFPDLARATFKLATGKWTGPLFDPKGLESLREDWFQMLPDPVRAREMIPNQPFYLRAIAQTLQILEDPDFRILEEGKYCFCNGVEVGHLEPIGPTPQVYRRRMKDQKYDESEWEPEMRNYRDGPGVEKALQAAFEKEELAGRMFPLSMSEARRRYPGDALRVAAQAVIPKPDNDFRVVHDGTHGVQVNNDVIMRDRLESPGAREVASLQRLGATSEERVFFGIVGDVSKAHRRFLHHPEHWGVLGCKTRADSSVVWLNRTGTFGVASAAYWFSRLIGLVGRLAFRVLLDTFIFMLIYADDLHVVSGGRERWINIWMMLALLSMQGTPFSDHKWRGGLHVDWVGYWIDYTRFHIGISEKRCRWISDCIDGLEKANWLVDVRRYHELHGRLGFMSKILIWIRPFLAPGYAWLAVVPKGAVLSLPNLVRCTLKFISSRLKAGCRTYPAGVGEKDLGELFRTDAACNENSVVLGGWFLHLGGEPSAAPWFQIILGREDVPWLFNEEGSAWASTSAELLASLVALHLLGRDFGELLGGPGVLRSCFSGGTDNKATEALSIKLLTTKVPLMFILMQYVGRCDHLGIRCHLSWRPRDANVEADQITKHCFDAFSAGRRLSVSWSEVDLSVLMPLLEFCNFRADLNAIKLDSQMGPMSGSVRFEKSVWG